MSAGAVVVTNMIANAIKASGVLLQVSAEDFQKIVKQSEKALIVHATSKIVRTRHTYLTSYKGLAFYTKVWDPLALLGNIELIEAKKITIPDM